MKEITRNTKYSDKNDRKKLMTVTTQATEVVNIRLPKEIIDIIDSLVKRGLYNSRSEAIRDFLRQYALEHSRLKGDEGR